LGKVKTHNQLKNAMKLGWCAPPRVRASSHAPGPHRLRRSSRWKTLKEEVEIAEFFRRELVIDLIFLR
jgi:hypothetical protein